MKDQKLSSQYLVLKQSDMLSFEKMANALDLAAFWLDRNGFIYHINDHAARLFGVDNNGLKDKQLFHLAPHLSMMDLLEKWKSLEEDSFLEWEFDIQHDHTKRVKVVIGMCLTVCDDKKLAWCLVKKKGKQKTLSASPVSVQSLKAEFYEFSLLALNSTSSMIFWLRDDFTIEYLNDRAKVNLSIEEDFNDQRLDFRTLDIEINEKEWHEYREEVRESGSRWLESSILSKAGKVVPVEYNLLWLESAKRSMLCVIARDITERRKKDATLRSAMLEIEMLSRKLEKENIYLKEELSENKNFNYIISKSKAYRKVLQKIAQVGITDSIVLIQGETGTGKELLARAIHNMSSLSDRQLVTVNCAALSRDLIESELFGHEKGAFTGAFESKPGRFEAANGGTILLDEIGEIPLGVQVKLLRVLQDFTFQRVGGNRNITVDVRVIASTNRDLEAMVKKGKFRSDLYYRLNVFPIYNIPLRERKEDIPLLVRHFIKKYNAKLGRKIKTVKPFDIERLMEYEFPGNIRELENIIERAMILSNGEMLNLTDWTIHDDTSRSNKKSRFETFSENQRSHIIAAMERCNWKVSGPGGAAELLQVNDKTLYSKIKKLGIERPGPT